MSNSFDSIKKGLEEALDYAKGNIRIGTRRWVNGQRWVWDGKEWRNFVDAVEAAGDDE